MSIDGVRPLARAERRSAERMEAAIIQRPAGGPTELPWLHWIPADRPLTPVASTLLDPETIFEIDGDCYSVAERKVSMLGPQADLLVIAGSELVDGDAASVKRSVQVCDLEELIDQGLVDIVFGPETPEHEPGDEPAEDDRSPDRRP